MKSFWVYVALWAGPFLCTERVLAIDATTCRRALQSGHDFSSPEKERWDNEFIGYIFQGRPKLLRDDSNLWTVAATAVLEDNQPVIIKLPRLTGDIMLRASAFARIEEIFDNYKSLAEDLDPSLFHSFLQKLHLASSFEVLVDDDLISTDGKVRLLGSRLNGVKQNIPYLVFDDLQGVSPGKYFENRIYLNSSAGMRQRIHDFLEIAKNLLRICKFFQSRSAYPEPLNFTDGSFEINSVDLKIKFTGFERLRFNWGLPRVSADNSAFLSALKNLYQGIRKSPSDSPDYVLDRVQNRLDSILAKDTSNIASTDSNLLDWVSMEIGIMEKELSE